MWIGGKTPEDLEAMRGQLKGAVTNFVRRDRPQPSDANYVPTSAAYATSAGRANVLRARGVPLREAIVESCRTRLRPILMTTSAIIAGLVPTSLGLGIGGQGRAAIAITVIGGQALCLFLTLLLVPVAYVKFDALESTLAGGRGREWLGRLHAATFGRLRPSVSRNT